MTQFNIAKAKAHFSKLMNKAMLGEEVALAKANKPLLTRTPLLLPNKRAAHCLQG